MIEGSTLADMESQVCLVLQGCLRFGGSPSFPTRFSASTLLTQWCDPWLGWGGNYPVCPHALSSLYLGIAKGQPEMSPDVTQCSSQGAKSNPG